MKRTSDTIENLTPSFWTSLLFTLPFLVRKVDPWLQCLLATIILVVGALPFLDKIKSYNRFTPIGLSVLVAYVFSLFEFFFVLKPVFFFKEVAIVTTAVLFWLHLEKRLLEAAYQRLDSFFSLVSKKALKLFPDARLEEVDVDTFQAGDCAQVKKGQTFAVDGILLANAVDVDESLLFGKGQGPVHKKFGDTVFAGTKNISDSCSVKATKSGRDTLYAQIVRRISHALQEDTQSQVQGIHFLFVLAFLSFLFWSVVAGVSQGVIGACSVLVAVPLRGFDWAASLVNVQAITAALSRGIVLGSSSVCERLCAVSMLVMGKRGILTQAKPVVFAIEPVEGVSQKELLQVAASLERHSDHPIGVCVVKKAASMGVELLDVHEVLSVTGLGLTGKMADLFVAVGDEELIAKHFSGQWLELKAKAHEFRKQGFVVLFCGKKSQNSTSPTPPIGIIVISDPVQASAKSAVTGLKERRIQLFCLSGDRRITVAHVAYELGLDRFQSESSLDQKVKALEKMKKEGHVLALLASDPAVEAKRVVDVCLSMGHFVPEDVDAAILSTDLSQIVVLWDLSELAMSIRRNNRLVCWLYSSVALFLAFFRLIDIQQALFAMMAVSMFVGAHCFRLNTRFSVSNARTTPKF